MVPSTDDMDIGMNVLLTAVTATGRKWDYYDESTTDHVFCVEDETEGAVLFGVVKDSLSKFDFRWHQLRHRNQWFGEAKVDGTDIGVVMSIQHRRGRLGFCLDVAIRPVTGPVWAVTVV